MCMVLDVTAWLCDGYAVLCGVADSGLVCGGLMYCSLYYAVLWISAGVEMHILFRVLVNEKLQKQFRKHPFLLHALMRDISDTEQQSDMTYARQILCREQTIDKIIQRSPNTVTCCQCNLQFHYISSGLSNVTTNSPRFMSMLSAAATLRRCWSRLVALHR